MSEPTALDLDAIRARCDAATPGPWSACGCHKCARVWSVPADTCIATGIGAEDEGYTLGDGVSNQQREINAAFIAAARSDMPALLAHAEQDAATIKALRESNHAIAGERQQALAELDRLKQQHAETLAAMVEDHARSNGALAARVAALEAQHARDADTIVGLTKDRKRAYEIMAEVGTLAEWRKVPGNRTLEIEYKVAEPVIRQGGMEIVEYVLAEMARKIRAALRPGAPREEGAT